MKSSNQGEVSWGLLIPSGNGRPYTGPRLRLKDFGIESSIPEERYMNTSQNGINLIKSFEELRLHSYKDDAGVNTIGYGSTRYATGRPIGPNDTITEVVADILLTQKIHQNDVIMNHLIRVPINQNKWDSISSLMYNIGDGAFSESTLLRLLNAGDDLGASKQFIRWDKITVKGKKISSPGLLNRRKKETKLFLS